MLFILPRHFDRLAQHLMWCLSCQLLFQHYRKVTHTLLQDTVLHNRSRPQGCMTSLCVFFFNFISYLLSAAGQLLVSFPVMQDCSEIQSVLSVLPPAVNPCSTRELSKTGLQLSSQLVMTFNSCYYQSWLQSIPKNSCDADSILKLKTCHLYLLNFHLLKVQ